MATAATLPRPITVTRRVSIARSGKAPTSIMIGVIASSNWFLRPTSNARGMTTTREGKILLLRLRNFCLRQGRKMGFPRGGRRGEGRYEKAGVDYLEPTTANATASQ